MPKQLQVFGVLVSLAALTLLPLSAWADAGLGTRVPLPTAASQIPISQASGGGFVYAPVGFLFTDGVHTTFGGGTASTTSVLTANASGGNNGVQVNSNGTPVVVLWKGNNGSLLEVYSGGNLTEQINGSGDFYLLGGTSASPRFFGGASGGSVRFSPGDPNQIIQGGSGQDLLISSYTPIVVYPGSHTSPPASVGYNSSAPACQFIGLVPGNVLMSYQIASGQTADADQLITSTGTVLRHTTASGKTYAQGFGVRAGATDTDGYTGAIPTTAQSLSVHSGIITGYVNSAGTQIGNS